MIDFLLSEAILEKARHEVKSVQTPGIQIAHLNEETRRAYDYYRLFDEDLRTRAGLASSSEEDAFYNQYYWYLVFSKLYQASSGFDAGVEQQAFRLLESAPEGVSWDRIDQIARSVGAE